MKYKIAELSGATLDAAVAKALGMASKHTSNLPDWYPLLAFYDGYFGDGFEPSTRFDHGGPVIERYDIELGGLMAAMELNLPPAMQVAKIVTQRVGDSAHLVIATGQTKLIAAMRAYCLSVFGPEVEL